MAGSIREEGTQRECKENRRHGMHSRSYGRRRSDKKKKYRLKQVKVFKYIGSMISENGGYEEEVRHRVGAAWDSGKKCQEYYET